MLHTPNCSLHLQEETGVVVFMFLELPTGVHNDAVLPMLVQLRQYRSQAAWLLLISQAGVGYEGIGAISSGVVNDRL
jgi:hypothetical protein